MEPVVGRLEEIYAGDIEFQRIDANSKDGKAIFQAYRLLGHPSFLVIDPGGEVLWTGLGEQSEEALGQILQDLIANPE